MVFNEAQPNLDQTKPKLTDNTPQVIKQKALGIIDLQVTPFGKWLYQLHEGISDEQGHLEKKATIEDGAKHELGKLNQVIDSSLQKDPRGYTQDRIEDIINTTDLQDRLFNYDSSNILSPDYDQSIRYAQFFMDKLRTVRTILNNKDFVEKLYLILALHFQGR